MMADTTEIEKKSLEAHVELCAERYRFLEEKLDTLERSVASVKSMIEHMQQSMSKLTEKRNDQLISWGLGIIGLLTGCVGYLLAKYVF